MTRLSLSRFRVLLLLNAVLLLLGLGMDVVYPNLSAPGALGSLQQELLLQKPTLWLALASGAQWLVLLLSLLSLVGMFLLRGWGRRLALVALLLDFVGSLVDGFFIASGWRYFLEQLWLLSAGLTLACAYYSPLALKFSASVQQGEGATDANEMLNYRRFALGANLRTGLRAALLFPVKRERMLISANQFVLLLVLLMVFQCVADFLQVGSEGLFSIYGLETSLMLVPLVLCSAWVISLCCGRQRALPLLATLLLALLFWVQLGTLLAAYALIYLPPNWLVRNLQHYLLWVSAAWLAVSGALAAARVLELRLLSAALTSALLAVLLAYPLVQMDSERGIWIPPYEDNTGLASPLQTEDIFYAQSSLLEQQLAALQAQPSSDIKLYFIGLAGDAGQNVFMKEVEYVRDLFDRRFDTEGRSLMLINNAETANEIPIASVTSLERSLQRVGEVMDKDKDILFLYLSSHGSQDHRLALDFGGMQFNDLNPQRLREMLDTSGIKRRVIVVSACYAGGFIDALKTDDTLVITAAAPDKTSFGCSNEADFTYFGKAYFDEALQHTDSFIDAFDIAKPIISRREESKGFEHSDPRIFIGRNIRLSLQEFEHQLEHREKQDGTGNRHQLPLQASADSLLH